MKKNIPLLLMGCGGVGCQLLQHIVSCRSLHSKLGVHLRVVGVCDSKSLLVASDVLTTELDDTSLTEVCQVKLKGSSLLTLGNSGQCKVFLNPEAMGKIIDVATLLGRSTGLAFIDCSASSETIGVLNRVVDLGCCVVMANKKPLTSSMEDYDKLLAYPRRIRHESTVGAGLPVIASLNRILSSGDPVHHIIGSLSGTLGYVMSEVEDGKPFSQVVKSAKSLGYTEPDPRDDLSGMDVARKALILARLLGQRIDLDNIKVESLYPEEMGPNIMHVEDFLVNGLPLLDKGIQERVERASSNGNVLRYVCVIEDSRAAVMWVDEQDGEAIELAFSKKKIEARKNWLRQFEVLQMTLQNAPPGLDYEQDKKFSKSFKQMTASCLVKDPSKQPSAKKLLKHSFFKQS